jgi:hypothetical protein
MSVAKTPADPSGGLWRAPTWTAGHFLPEDRPEQVAAAVSSWPTTEVAG